MGTGRKKNEKKGSWAVFFMVIGMIFIMLSPQVEQPMSLIVTGLAIILTTLSLNLLSNWMRIALDPVQRWRLEMRGRKHG